MVYPGRNYDWDGDALFIKYHYGTEETGAGEEEHTSGGLMTKAEKNEMFIAAGLFGSDDGHMLNSLGEASVAGNGIDDKSEFPCEDDASVVCGTPMEDTNTSYPKTSSRQFTFFFALFVLFQITNMLASRKIHDEFNIFSGIFDNFVFIAVWIFILVLQVILT